MLLFQFDYIFLAAVSILDTWANAFILPSLNLSQITAPMPELQASDATIISKSGLKCVNDNSDVNVFYAFKRFLAFIRPISHHTFLQ